MTPQQIDITGKTFGNYRVVKLTKHRRGRHPMWLVECTKCGKRRETYSFEVRQARKTDRTHCCSPLVFVKKMGLYREYSSYIAMKRRCLDKREQSYKHYGGRGITVCERWLESFKNFYADMGRRPRVGLSLDRINNDGNYEPSNCRWADAKTQGNNRRGVIHDKFYKAPGISNQRKWQLRNAAAGLCIKCAKPLERPSTLCNDCYEKWARRQGVKYSFVLGKKITTV